MRNFPKASWQNTVRQIHRRHGGKDSGASWEINVAQDGEYILEAWYTFPWTATASARYELKCGNSAPFLWNVPTSGGGEADGGIYHLGRMNLVKGKQTFTLKKKGGTAFTSAISGSFPSPSSR